VNQRTQIGLQPYFVDIKDSAKDPSLRYVERPDIASKSELNLKRRQENFEEFKKTEALQGLHKDGM
jgi:hypothetical protein